MIQWPNMEASSNRPSHSWQSPPFFINVTINPSPRRLAPRKLEASSFTTLDPFHPEAKFSELYEHKGFKFPPGTPSLDFPRFPFFAPFFFFFLYLFFYAPPFRFHSERKVRTKRVRREILQQVFCRYFKMELQNVGAERIASRWDLMPYSFYCPKTDFSCCKILCSKLQQQTFKNDNSFTISKCTWIVSRCTVWILNCV